MGRRRFKIGVTGMRKNIDCGDKDDKCERAGAKSGSDVYGEARSLCIK
jgi:hypothetical protein